MRELIYDCSITVIQRGALLLDTKDHFRPKRELKDEEVAMVMLALKELKEEV